jgi:hypothetical protein
MNFVKRFEALIRVAHHHQQPLAIAPIAHREEIANILRLK